MWVRLTQPREWPFGFGIVSFKKSSLMCIHVDIPIPSSQGLHPSYTDVSPFSHMAVGARSAGQASNPSKNDNMTKTLAMILLRTFRWALISSSISCPCDQSESMPWMLQTCLGSLWLQMLLKTTHSKALPGPLYCTLQDEGMHWCWR